MKYLHDLLHALRHEVDYHFDGDLVAGAERYARSRVDYPDHAGELHLFEPREGGAEQVAEGDAGEGEDDQYREDHGCDDRIQIPEHGLEFALLIHYSSSSWRKPAASLVLQFCRRFADCR